MFEFFGVRVVSSALRVQILLCTELLQCKGWERGFFSGISRSGGKSLF
jgi:hypothetical protein